jgi:hypothetical protein
MAAIGPARVPTVTTSALHIVFNPSAAVDLRRALRESGRDVCVVGLFDDFSYGPINPPDPETRQKWVQDELGYTGFEDVFDETKMFWREALEERDRKIAWISRRSAPEYSGFLEWLWRLDERPCEVVDLTDMTLAGRDEHGLPTPPKLAVSLALLLCHQILENNLIDRAQTLTSAAREQYRDLWRRLRAENAPLRVLNADGLVSAPITFFDSLLLSAATSQWQNAARVVGAALSKSRDDTVQTGDLVLVARMHALVELGLLEARGDLSNVQQSDVRLPN